MGRLSDAWAGVLVGLIGGFLTGYLFFRLSREHPRLSFRILDTELVETKSDPDDPIGILFDQQSVPRVNKVLLYLWNSGRKTARGPDIVGSDPLRLSFAESAQVLRARIVTVTRETNNVRVVSGAGNEAVIAFDYLEPGDGCVIEVLHTGDVDERKLVGSVMGMPRGPREDTSSEFVPRGVRPAAVVMMILGVAFASAVALTSPGAPSGNEKRVQGIVQSLTESEQEVLTTYVEENGTLPEGTEGDEEWIVYLLCALFFGFGLSMQISAASTNRPPLALKPRNPRKRIRLRKRKATQVSTENSEK